MKRNFPQLTSTFFLIVFLLNGTASLMPLFSLQSFKQSVAELLATTETENAGKEKEEKTPKKELIQHITDLELPLSHPAITKKYCSIYSTRWQNVCLAIFTPPPEQA